jgi:hypothetical protein
VLRFLILRSLVVRLEQQVLLVPLVLPVQQVRKVQQELTALMALLDHKDLQELPAQLEPLVLQALMDLMVQQQQSLLAPCLQVLLVLAPLLLIAALQAQLFLTLQFLAALLALLARLVRPEPLVQRVLTVAMVQTALMVQLQRLQLAR